jgi:hypothetical protein
MRLLERSNNGQISLKEFSRDKIPPYIILLYRWGDKEVTFEDLKADTEKNKQSY